MSEGALCLSKLQQGSGAQLLVRMGLGGKGPRKI